MSAQSQDGVPWWRNDPWNGRHLFWENRGKFPAEELRKYNGRHVAWFPDGSGIHDSDPDPDALRDPGRLLAEVREEGPRVVFSDAVEAFVV